MDYQLFSFRNTGQQLKKESQQLVCIFSMREVIWTLLITLILLWFQRLLKSLCNVINRIIAKTTANTLKQVLYHIVTPTESVFILNKLITDNIIIGHECLHKIRHNKGKKKYWVAFKLDINKVYDRVEYSFLQNTIHKLGFFKVD